MTELFPDAPTETAKDKAAKAYQVLARKYRPQSFADLIGHGPMVRTLTNAFASGRIAHAYILTGVRGVGKTTTARILARALNYVGPDGADKGPQMQMAEEGRHCAAIAESRHPDVLEMDAASRTGVGDIRELIEGVRYAPVEARYKVYIIDEVHMLSTAAFNALLKTLEEPPEHVKFIFATTEIRKVPVTVLSRCQRFDLRRIDPDTMIAHLAKIAAAEEVAISEEGIAMIARAAEGSVRDALSILDQAIVQHAAQAGGGEAVGAAMIRDMLGLADRSKVWDLLEAALAGDAKAALEAFAAQYDAGAEPAVILRDMIELTHLLTRVKAAGDSAAKHGPAGEADAARAKDMAGRLEMNALTRAWSLLMKGLNETQSAPDPSAAGEMALIRLSYAADLPTPDEALRALKKNTDGAAARSLSVPLSPSSSPSQTPPAAPPAVSAPVSRASARPDPQDFQEVVKLAGKMRDAKLRTELESYVHLVSFVPGHIELRFHEAAPADLAGRLTQQLKAWTGRQWIVSVNAGEAGADTLRDKRYAEVMDDPMVKEAFALFPDAEILSIREPEAAPDDLIGPAPDELEDDPPIDPEDPVAQLGQTTTDQRNA